MGVDERGSVSSVEGDDFCARERFDGGEWEGDATARDAAVVADGEGGTGYEPACEEWRASS